MKKPENLKEINQSFELQAAGFESGSLNFTKEDYLKKTVDIVAPDKGMTMLEVAAGTCAVSRSFAPYVNLTVCLDATEAMLHVGRTEAEKSRLNNMVFVKGYAEELPFLSDTFDIVISRLAFHHFTAVQAVFDEMVRVLKPGGRIVMIDMLAPKEELRGIRDEIETLRDPSHVRNLSKAEMMRLFQKKGLLIEVDDVTRMSVELENWMKLTKIPEDDTARIRSLMDAEINGGDKTGFYPYRTDKGIRFDQKWEMLIGKI